MCDTESEPVPFLKGQYTSYWIVIPPFRPLNTVWIRMWYLKQHKQFLKILNVSIKMVIHFFLWNKVITTVKYYISNTKHEYYSDSPRAKK
jgi:hypothetical protein